MRGGGTGRFIKNGRGCIIHGNAANERRGLEHAGTARRGFPGDRAEMSSLKEPKPVRLITGVIFAPGANIGECMEELSRKFGDEAYRSAPLHFGGTHYYEGEMGTGLSRVFTAYKRLIPRETIRDVKIFTNEVEKVFSYDGGRTINIDPGYIAEEHLILATGKGFSHRPYLGGGVYADLTLMYVNDEWKPLDWTYPDYRKPETMELFRKLRNEYSKQLKEEYRR